MVKRCSISRVTNVYIVAVLIQYPSPNKLHHPDVSVIISLFPGPSADPCSYASDFCSDDDPGTQYNNFSSPSSKFSLVPQGKVAKSYNIIMWLLISLLCCRWKTVEGLVLLRFHVSWNSHLWNIRRWLITIHIRYNSLF